MSQKNFPPATPFRRILSKVTGKGWRWGLDPGLSGLSTLRRWKWLFDTEPLQPPSEVTLFLACGYTWSRHSSVMGGGRVVILPNLQAGKSMAQGVSWLTQGLEQLALHPSYSPTFPPALFKLPPSWFGFLKQANIILSRVFYYPKRNSHDLVLTILALSEDRTPWSSAS